MFSCTSANAEKLEIVNAETLKLERMQKLQSKNPISIRATFKMLLISKLKNIHIKYFELDFK